MKIIARICVPLTHEWRYYEVPLSEVDDDEYWKPETRRCSDCGKTQRKRLEVGMFPSYGYAWKTIVPDRSIDRFERLGP